MGKVIEERHFPTAEGLAKALSPFDDFWLSTGGARRWQFRGQRDDAWKLVPSSMRPGALYEYAVAIAGMVGAPKDMIKTTRVQVKAEQEVVFHFVRGALAAGLPIPEDSQLFRNKDLVLALIGGESVGDQQIEGVNVPLSLHRSIYALAQHHGVPTRLLDWSSSPFIAAYFACAPVAKSLYREKSPPKGTKGSNIAIFALRDLAIRDVDFDRDPKGFEPSIDVVEAPYRDNPNLKAQKGTFTLLRYNTPRESHDWRNPALEEILTRWCAHKHGDPDHDSDSFPFLVKFTTPLNQCRKLLRLLSDVQVCAPTIFPSYDAVRLGMAEESYWDEQ